MDRKPNIFSTHYLTTQITIQHFTIFFYFLTSQFKSSDRKEKCIEYTSFPGGSKLISINKPLFPISAIYFFAEITTKPLSRYTGQKSLWLNRKYLNLYVFRIPLVINGSLISLSIAVHSLYYQFDFGLCQSYDCSTQWTYSH